MESLYPVMLVLDLKMIIKPLSNQLLSQTVVANSLPKKMMTNCSTFN